jgi:hypothetical protein
MQIIAGLGLVGLAASSGRNFPKLYKSMRKTALDITKLSTRAYCKKSSIKIASRGASLMRQTQRQGITVEWVVLVFGETKAMNFNGYIQVITAHLEYVMECCSPGEVDRCGGVRPTRTGRAAFLGRRRRGELGADTGASSAVWQVTADVARFATHQFLSEPDITRSTEDLRVTNPKYTRMQCSAVAPDLDQASKNLETAEEHDQPGALGAKILVSQAWSGAAQSRYCPDIKAPPGLLIR